MAANVGLTTPRGSGTSGYVQRNLSHLKPRDNYAPYPKDYDQMKHRQRKPDKDILDQDRLREIEVKVFDLRDKLEDGEYVFLSCPSYRRQEYLYPRVHIVDYTFVQPELMKTRSSSKRQRFGKSLQKVAIARRSRITKDNSNHIKCTSWPRQR